MFKLHIFLINICIKIRYSITQIIISSKQNFIHLTKNALFNILSLANQLYQSKSNFLQDLKLEKLYF